VIRVLIAEDQAMVRGALVSLLGLEEDVDVVAEVGRGDEVAEAARRSGAEVALLDIGLPGMDGLEVAAALHDELPRAIRAAAAGERVVDPGLAAAALSQGENPLTEREREVLAEARRHGTVAELAAALHLSPGTTRNHLSSIIRKLDVRSRIEAIRVAEERGWL
jgi:two-component system, NarL family, response regulator DesR